MIWPGHYVGITLATGHRELWGLEAWIADGPVAVRVEVLTTAQKAVAWAEQHRVLRETPPQDLDRWIDMTAKYLTLARDDASAEAQVRDIAASATTASIRSTLPEIEESDAG